MSPWRSRPDTDKQKGSGAREKEKERESKQPLFVDDDTSSSTSKKGIWGWKPIRALSHIGMQKLSCLFSVEVVAAQGLPASMNGLRLSVCVRKKETKEGAVHTMPSRVSQGAADFEETLFIKSNVYCTQSSGSQALKFEPRPFVIYVFAVDATELDFGRSSVDLSRIIQESLEKNAQGARIRQWDISFDLAGKAKGGQLQVKLAFQIMEKDGGTGLLNQLESAKSGKDKRTSMSYTFGRKQSKSSFSIPSPKLSSRMEVWTPSHAGTNPDIQGIDDLNLDEPAPSAPSLPEPQKSKEQEVHTEEEELDLPEFEVVDKGVEIQNNQEETKEEDLNNNNNEEKAEDGSESSEVVKEMVHDQFHLTRLTELDSIAQQIKALESMMNEENLNNSNEETESQKLDADEETVTMEFLQMLEDEEEAGEIKPFQLNNMPIPPLVNKKETEKKTTAAGGESREFLPDLGKGLGSVVQTKNGGFLVATNPLNVVMSRKDTPKLAMQISKPFVLTLDKSIGGFELFQRMAAAGVEDLGSEVLTLMPIEELAGKTAEQVAFEGIASAIISGRNKEEGASSSAARSLAIVKKMANAMSMGRKERITTGIWNVTEDPLTPDEMLAFSMQKIEAMSVDALKIQAEMAEEDAPFEVSPLSGKAGVQDQKHPLASAIPLEDWIKDGGKVEDYSVTIALAMLVELRDPLRRYEAVGGPMIVLIQATPVETKEGKMGKNAKFRVTSLHVGGMKAQKGRNKNAWDSEKQRLTAMQWLVAYNMGRAAKKDKTIDSKGQDILWSISSRVVADMWLKPIRNPDVKFTK